MVVSIDRFNVLAIFPAGRACFANPFSRNLSTAVHSRSVDRGILVFDRICRLPDRRRGRVLRTGKRLSIQDVKFPGRREKHKATAIPDDEARRTMVSLYDVIIGHVGACRCGLQINVCWRDR